MGCSWCCERPENLVCLNCNDWADPSGFKTHGKMLRPGRTSDIDTKYIKNAWRVINAAGKVPKSVYLDMFEDMEQKYPGRGWHQQAVELERHWYKEITKDIPF